MRSKEERKAKGKAFGEEFKKFLLRGNIIDMAVGVVVGAAFKAIVDSFVNSIIMPLLSLVTNNSLEEWKVILPNGSELLYGQFIEAIINFLIIATSVFMALKAINYAGKLMKKAREGIIDVLDGDDNKKAPAATAEVAAANAAAENIPEAAADNKPTEEKK